ncbi:RodZ family helix-turn-helix domain-containing protein [Patulibacter sp.]|uniref:helix-turn-helix domain-containing protein n=1 Tax=Patulibacter sp. TaxID=1912859 RepID=UPI002720E256|nr:helix-turn-helix domain-containing protein [Patulibacter sp.]MDO9407060.1 helix-turn-helix domain-containing protein [Patulibacter sp.]
MPEIGVTLREARMRAGIDIAEVESRTKIRAKYLRALENEEWSLLPGTTFVKSFLRTYAETLGLDAKLLVEEYKFRHEPYEVAQGSQGGAGPRRRRGGRRGRVGGGGGGGGAFGPQRRTSILPILVLLLIVAGAIFAVYRLSRSEDATSTSTTPTTTTATEARRTSETERIEARRERRRKAAIVRLKITAPRSEAASVCVTDASGKRVVSSLNLRAGRSTSTLRSRSFDVALSAGVTVRDGSRRLRLRADDKNVIAYRIMKDRRTRLPDSRRPSCT